VPGKDYTKGQRRIRDRADKKTQQSESENYKIGKRTPKYREQQYQYCKTPIPDTILSLARNNSDDFFTIGIYFLKIIHLPHGNFFSYLNSSLRLN
jgi:hypothetical protein